MYHVLGCLSTKFRITLETPLLALNARRNRDKTARVGRKEIIKERGNIWRVEGMGGDETMQRRLMREAQRTTNFNEV